MGEQRVRLQATDVEDLAVMAALLQDARTCVAEMVYEPESGRFAVAFVRYRRERRSEVERSGQMTECPSALVFEEVGSVRYRGIDEDARLAELNLLTIATQPARGQGIYIDLMFAGLGAIRLEGQAVKAKLDDFGEAVPCQIGPCDHFTAD